MILELHSKQPTRQMEKIEKSYRKTFITNEWNKEKEILVHQEKLLTGLDPAVPHIDSISYRHSANVW